MNWYSYFVFSHTAAQGFVSDVRAGTVVQKFVNSVFFSRTHQRRGLARRRGNGVIISLIAVTFGAVWRYCRDNRRTVSHPRRVTAGANRRRHHPDSLITIQQLTLRTSWTPSIDPRCCRRRRQLRSPMVASFPRLTMAGHRPPTARTIIASATMNTLT